MHFSFLLLICSACPTAAGQGWLESFRHDVFTIRSEVRVSQSTLLRDLVTLKRDLSRDLKLKINDEPIKVHLFQNRNTYTAHLQRRVKTARNQRALFIKDDEGGSIYVYNSRQFFTDVRHESTHALLHNALPFLPLWLDEGLAEYFENAPALRSSPGQLTGVRWKARLGWKPNLKDLEAANTATDLGDDGYRDAWAWVHFLMNESDASRSVLVDYLSAIQAGDPPGPFSTYCTKRMPDSEKRLIRHFRRFSMTRR